MCTVVYSVCNDSMSTHNSNAAWLVMEAYTTTCMATYTSCQASHSKVFIGSLHGPVHKLADRRKTIAGKQFQALDAPFHSMVTPSTAPKTLKCQAQ